VSFFYADNDIPLVVDLDGTLIKTDLLYEGSNASLALNPLTIFRLLKKLIKGKAALKADLSARHQPDFSQLPLNSAVIDWLRREKQQGRKLILATASHDKLAQQAADYLGCFDDVMATDGEHNLIGRNKRDALIARYGEQGFDYLGDAAADKPIWQVARTAHAVSPSRSTLGWLKNNVQLGKVFHKQSSSLKSFVRALRPHQWAKNVLLFVPLITAHLYTQPSAIVASIWAFVVFSITASSVYILNDLVDVQADRQHPRKRKRPFAAGDLSLLTGWVSWPALLLLAVIIGWQALPLGFMETLVAYFALTLTYSLYLKRQPLVDVLVLAGLYTIRIYAGTTALTIPISFWLLSFSLFIFLSLAFMKRVSELKSTMDAADGQKKMSGRGYVRADFELISAMGIAAGFISVVFLALFVQDQGFSSGYQTPTLIWLCCPLLLFWIARAWLLTHRGEMHDDPVLFAIKDKASWVCGAAFALIIVLARYAL
jgi:4-hydroxybenzoate polyprenyltransferase/phosphoserine phosphatase